MLIPKHSLLYNNFVHQLVPLARNGEEILKLHAKVLKNKLTEEKVNKNEKMMGTSSENYLNINRLK